MTLSSVTIQITPESMPSTPSWMGEVTAFARVLTHAGILKAIQDQVRFARARFGHYDLIDFVVVLIGYAVSGEPTLLAFYERLLPFSDVFMALFGRHHLPSRSALSRFLAALDQASVEALRTLFRDRYPGPCPVCWPWWDRRSMRAAVSGHRCRWNQASRSPTSLAANGIAARSPSPF